jgi:hypothetical protein
MKKEEKGENRKERAFGRVSCSLVYSYLFWRVDGILFENQYICSIHSMTLFLVAPGMLRTCGRHRRHDHRQPYYYTPYMSCPY